VTLVPVKTGSDPMTRLADSTPSGVRRDLMLRLLRRTLDVLEAAGMQDVRVVTRHADVRALAAGRGVRVLGDRGEGPNVAVGEAAEGCFASGAHRVAVLAADLPLLHADDIRLLLRGGGPGMLTIGQDRFGFGTNAVVTPTRSFPFTFGPDSFRRHASAAHRLGLEVVVARSPGLATDLDEPWDLDLASAVEDPV
jgi:2-phospho-L-lactate guanylyltransferase